MTSLRRYGRLFWSLFLVGVSLTQASQPRKPDHEKLQLILESLRARDHLALTVSIVSVNTLFVTNLDRDRFENYITNPGPDYLIRIGSSEMVRRVIDILFNQDLKEGRPPEKLDLRYKLEFMNRHKIALVLYAERFGGLLHENESLQPQGGELWIRQLWQLVEQEIVLKKPSEQHRKS